MAIELLTREFTEDVADGAESTVLLIRPKDLPTVRLLGVSGTGRAVQYTTSPEAEVRDGTADWDDWPDGVVTGDLTTRVLGAITALRLSPTGGAGTWEVVA